MDTGRPVAARRHMLPDFLGGKGQQWRHYASKAIQQIMHNGLSAFAGDRFRRCGVQTIFENVQIKSGKIKRAIIMQRMVDDMILILIIGFKRFFDQGLKFVQRKPVYLRHIIIGNFIGLRIEVKQIAQHKSAGVSDAPVGIA